MLWNACITSYFLLWGVFRSYVTETFLRQKTYCEGGKKKLMLKMSFLKLHECLLTEILPIIWSCQFTTTGKLFPITPLGRVTNSCFLWDIHLHHFNVLSVIFCVHELTWQELMTIGSCYCCDWERSASSIHPTWRATLNRWWSVIRL